MNDYHVEVSGFITSLYLCRSLGVFSKFPPSRAYRCSTGDNIFWRGWLMCSASLCLSLGGGGGGFSHQRWALSLTQTQMPGESLRTIWFTAFSQALIHLFFVCLLPPSLPLSFLSYVPCFARYSHSDCWIEIMGRAVNIYEFFLVQYPKIDTCTKCLAYIQLHLFFSVGTPSASPFHCIH